MLRRALARVSGMEGARLETGRGGFDSLRDRLRERRVDLDEVLRALVDAAKEAVSADRATLFLVDQAREELVSRTAHLPEITEIRLRLGEGVAGWVARSGERVQLREGQRDPRLAHRIDALTGYSTRSMLAWPVRDPSGAVVGVLQVLNRRGGDFTEADEAVIRELSRGMGEVLAASSLGRQLSPGNQRPLAFGLNRIVGTSPTMRAVYEKVIRVGRAEETVLLRGESGSGKELVAHAIHDNSPRANGPFVVVDLAALPPNLIESELFGHVRGAYTGADRDQPGRVELAQGGTLFLDEIGELPFPLQARLLRLLQERTYFPVGSSRMRSADVRFVTATHRDLEAMVAEGQLRADLYYRVRVLEISLPPLRERGPEDLDRLIDHFVYEAAKRGGRSALTLHPEARRALHAHAWPGNVRELQSSIQAAVVMTDGPEIERSAIPGLGLPRRAAAVPDPDTFRCAPGTLAEVEQAYLHHVLSVCAGNRSQAARVLGIGRNTLARKLKEPLT